MSEYLSKEEIRKWRSSLERITLEEYAARLGKIIQSEKHDDSLVDNVDENIKFNVGRRLCSRNRKNTINCY